MAHSIEIRMRAVELSKEGYTQKYISKILKVGISSIKRWINQVKDNGTITVYYDTSNRTAPKVPADKLKSFYEANSDSLLKEAANHFNCTPQAVFYACKRNKLTYKKKNHITKNAMKKND